MRRVPTALSSIASLAFCPHKPLLALAGWTGFVLIDTAQLREEKPTFRHIHTRDGLTKCAWHPTQSGLLACAGMDGVIELYNTRGTLQRQLVNMPGQQGPMTALAFTTHGERLAFGGGWWEESGCVLVVATNTWLGQTAFYQHSNQVGALCFTTPTMLATGAADRSVQFDDITTSQQAWHFPVRARVQDMTVSPDGTTLAVAAGSLVRLLTLRSDGLPEDATGLQCKGHQQAVRAIAFAPDGQTLASVGEDHVLHFWDTTTGAAKDVLDPQLGSLHTVAYAPDGLTVAVGGERGVLALVDVE